MPKSVTKICLQGYILLKQIELSEFYKLSGRSMMVKKKKKKGKKEWEKSKIISEYVQLSFLARTPSIQMLRGNSNCQASYHRSMASHFVVKTKNRRLTRKCCHNVFVINEKFEDEHLLLCSPTSLFICPISFRFVQYGGGSQVLFLHIIGLENL